MGERGDFGNGVSLGEALGRPSAVETARETAGVTERVTESCHVRASAPTLWLRPWSGMVGSDLKSSLIFRVTPPLAGPLDLLLWMTRTLPARLE